MSIQTEHTPEEFNKLFNRFDDPDRDKKDVAYRIWCAMKEKKSK